MKILFLLAPVLSLTVAAANAADSRRITNLHIQPVTVRPCLMFGPEDVPDLKRRFEALPVRPTPARLHGAMRGLLYGDESDRRKISADFMAGARKQFTVGKDGEYPGYRRYNEAMIFHDVISSFGHLSAAEEKEFRDMMIAGARHYVGEPIDPEKGELGGRHNRSIDQATVGLLAGLSFPDHPMASAWVEFGANLYRESLDQMVLDGAWSEVPRYHNWSVLLFSVAFQALERRAGVDFFQDAKFKSLLEWYVRFSSPLVRFPGMITAQTPDGAPTTPVWGDSNYGPMFEVCGMLASKYARTDPAFSRRLMWMWRRAGSPFQSGWQFDVVFPALADPRLPDTPQVLGSEISRTLGYMALRSGFDTRDESLVYMRGGRRGGLHPRADLGSIDFFSHGIPLALGSQSGPYAPEIEWNRSQKSNNVVVFGDQPRDRTDSNGTVLAFQSTPQADYAVADCSRPESRDVKKADAFRWVRHLLLVKNPDYLVVWDEIASGQSSEYFLHTTAATFRWEPGRMISRTDHGADLDTHVVLPAGHAAPGEFLGKFGGWLDADPKKGKSDPYPFTHLRYFTLKAAPDDDFLTVLHPRKPDGPALKPKLLRATNDEIRLEVVSPVSSDLVIIGNSGAKIHRRGGREVVLPRRVRE